MEKQTVKKTMDGNSAAAYSAYAFSEVAAIYPITPSSVMADDTDKYAAAGKKNIFGNKVEVIEMQSEAGAAGAIHGALSAGALATTFTSSQGLLLMIPNMYKITGELLPSVIHVAARTVAAHALSIFGDHSDVYACRQTGYAMLCANNPQEAMHFSAIAHLSAIKGHIPFLHFFDGFRTSHEIQKIDLLDYEDLKNLVDVEELNKFRNRSLNPNNPLLGGTAQNDDVYFQNREASNLFYDKIPEIVNAYMDEINKIAKTSYKPFEYYGAKDAENIIIAMGSVCETIEETIDHINKNGENVGLIKVRLYRPFSTKHFLEALPKSAKKITVLDRTKEAGSAGEPLYLDVVATLKNLGLENIEVFSGRYGLSSKNTTPSHILAAYKNMDSKDPKKRFTLGIKDDVTNLSLDIEEEIDTTPIGTFSCKFWGIGSDGTVGAAKNTIKIIGDNTEKYVQGFFEYDSKKSGGVTVSHLRFGSNPIKSTYYVDKADFVACHTPEYIYKYSIIENLKENGIFLLNCSWNEQELEKYLPNKIKKYIAKNNIKFYTIDAAKIAKDLGLGGRINTALQAAFFKITEIIEENKALEFIKDAIEKTYSKKGEKTVNINQAAAELGMNSVKKINIPKSWHNLVDEKQKIEIQKTYDENSTLGKFLKNIAEPINKREGNNLPVSAFTSLVDGKIPLGTSAFEKRGTANFVPDWIPENCIQCGFCSFVCPHGVIRLSVLTDEELKNAPNVMKSKKMIGFPNLNFAITISQKDCTGCENCVFACPGIKGNKALKMVQNTKENEIQETFDYCNQLKIKPEIFEKFKETTVKGIGFKKTLLEFSGACAGCGETPYAKLTANLFGNRMIIANATGCSSIWGGSFPSSPYTTNDENKGPAWQNSLFEDNAEFGLGIALAKSSRQKPIITTVEKLASETKDTYFKTLCQDYIKTINNSSENFINSKKLINYLENNKKMFEGNEELLNTILSNKNDINTKSIWMFGGDGWAYDIGFGGLDHVIASGENVNILVFDTEVYSNTGGQASKATPKGAVAQFASSGKQTPKKDLAAIAMTYGYVYVAKVSLGANFNQCMRAFIEAENYNGPSIIIAYAPCINHGIKGGMKNSLLSAKQAVESGYWELFRFDPRKKDLGANPLQIDSRAPSLQINEFLSTENRFKTLNNKILENKLT